MWHLLLSVPSANFALRSCMCFATSPTQYRNPRNSSAPQSACHEASADASRIRLCGVTAIGTSQLHVDESLRLLRRSRRSVEILDKPPFFTHVWVRDPFIRLLLDERCETAKTFS